MSKLNAQSMNRNLVMKLSTTQQEVLDLLRNGWEIGVSSGITKCVWIQKGGAGCGGESKAIRYSTFSALKKANLIEKTGFNCTTAKYNAVK